MIDFSKLKEIAGKLGGILVMDGNNPEFVIMSYDRFEKLDSKMADSETQLSNAGNPEEEEVIDLLNKEILALKEEVRQKELSEAQMV